MHDTSMNSNHSEDNQPKSNLVSISQIADDDHLYVNFVMSRVKPGEEIHSGLTESDAHLIHMLLGLAGEVGELIDVFKRPMIYNTEVNEATRDHIIEELGDIEYYMAGIRAVLGISRFIVLGTNVEKLSKRFPKGYSDEAAQTRADKAGESETSPITDEPASM